MAIKGKIKQICYKFKRKTTAKRITNNLGKIVIKNGRIFCYVDKRKIERKRRINFCYPMCYDDIELIRKYDLEKKVCFIIEHVDFAKGLYCSASKNVQVIFRKCSFRKHISIADSAGEIVFENNMYHQAPEEATILFFSASANSLRFVDEYLINSGYNSIKESPFSMIIRSNNLLFGNTLIHAGDGNSTIDIKADELTLLDTTINCPQISINSDKLTTTSSTIYADKHVIIENKNLDKISMIETPEMIYNGQKFVAENEKTIVIREDTVNLIRKRIELLETLKTLLESCVQINSQHDGKPHNETAPKTFSLK